MRAEVRVAMAPANRGEARAREARPLSKAQWLDIRRGAMLAKEVGAKASKVHGFAMWFPRPDCHDAHLESRSAQREGTDGVAAEMHSSPAVPNSRQRRSAARVQELLKRKRYASCRLRQVLLFVLKRRRREQVQAVWLAWQRRIQVLGLLKTLLWRAWTRRSHERYHGVVDLMPWRGGHGSQLGGLGCPP